MATLPRYADVTARNRLLATLTVAEWSQVERSFEPILMMPGEVLYEAGMPVDHLYFPTTSIISIECMMADGRTDALALVGSDGFAGVDVFLGSGSVHCRAVVLSEGWGYRIKRALLNQICAREGSMRNVLLRYTQSYITKLAQTTVCNRHHSIDQQVCRWLLMFLERYSSNELPLTQKHIGGLMGVRRESVTMAAGKLQRAGCIRYHRGQIAVIDRMGLEARACECHANAKLEAIV
jgi:CRP-like cAMP-binding protein